jgi:NADH dehydrogenase
MDRLVTLFGGGGFLGRYVAQQLLKSGARVRIAQSDPRRAYAVRPLSAVGQTQFAAVDIRDADRVAKVVAGSHGVVNLVGVLKGDFDGLHVEGARNIAAAARAAGAAAMVQVSALGADPQSPSEYGRTKGEGESAVREAFPDATIVRPSILFGRDDMFVNRFAGMARLLPVLPVVRPTVKLQPVYVADVAKAIASAVLDPDTHGGKTYEFGGPQVLTMNELMSWICAETERDRMLLHIPDPVGKALAFLTGWLPGAPITWDQWQMLQRDNVVADKTNSLRAFGISPTPLAAVAESWLSQYRKHGRFAAKSPY